MRSPELVDLVAHRKPEVIFHLAAQADVRVSVGRPLFDAEVNILGSLNVCEAALAAGDAQGGVRRLGRHALRRRPRSSRCARATRSARSRPTASSKKAAGDYLHYYREIHGLEYTVLALANVYGPRQDPHGEAGVVAIFAGQLLGRRAADDLRRRQADPRLRVRRRRRRALVRATEKGGGLLMNIGTGVETSVQELFDTMARLTGYKEPPRYAPARAGELLRSALDPGRAEIHLGWKPWTTLEEGLRRTIDHFRTHKR